VKSENQASHSSQPEAKSRSISTSFRDKVRRVFGRSISNKNKFPAQQLDASRPYFRGCIDGSGIQSALDRYFVDDNDTTVRGSLYIPSSHECDSLEDLDRMSPTMRSAQSMEGLHSNARSRVTSCTISNSWYTFGTQKPFYHQRRRRVSLALTIYRSTRGRYWGVPQTAASSEWLRSTRSTCR
jgi:hypothetical protein